MNEMGGQTSGGVSWVGRRSDAMMMPVVRSEAWRSETAWVETYMTGTLKVSNMIRVKRSRLAFGLRGASVSKPGCSTRATLS